MRRQGTARCEVCDTALSSGTGKRFVAGGRFCSRRCEQGDPQERFWSHVDKASAAPCWIWTGKMNTAWSAYGRTRWDGSMRLAHHVAWLLLRGAIPEGQILRHRCPGRPDTRCVNPDHLLPGTRADNVRDMLADGNHWSQTGSYAPPKKEAPPGMPSATNILRVVVPTAFYKRLQALADQEGVSLSTFVHATLKAALDGSAGASRRRVAVANIGRQEPSVDDS